VSKGLFGGALPWGMVQIGAGIGVAIIVLDEVLRARGSKFRTPVLAVAVGIYLPLELMTPIFLGGLLTHLAQKAFGDAARDPAAAEHLGRKGMLFAAGMITGEALMGILIAVPIVVSGRADVLALPVSLQFGRWLGLVVLAGLAAWLYRTATARDAATAPVAPPR
jgi:putative OPT family oligopeptide transporter